MRTVKLEIKDQVNCRLNNIDPATKRELREKFKYFQSWAPHTPQFKAKWWDGYEYLIDQGGRTFLGLLDEIIPWLVDRGWTIELDDQRSDFTVDFPIIDNQIFADKVWPEKHKHAGEPIVLNDHQVDAINTFFNNTTCIQELPTSSGKTLITAALAYFIEPYGNSIVIVPNKSLVNQTEEDFKNLGLDVGVYYGDRKEMGHTHTICTWQILNVLEKKGKHSVNDQAKLMILLDGVAAVIVDEVHQAKAKALKNLLSKPLSHVALRWGLTGTIPREKYDKAIIYSMLGMVVNTVSPKELQELGHLANCHINVLQLEDEAEFRNYHEEMQYLVTDEKRIEWFSKFISEISESGNTLVLVNRIPTGEKLKELIDSSAFISGKMKVLDRKEHYDEVHDASNKIIIATYGVASIGINIPRIFNLIIFEPGKSFIRVIQSIGRGLRVAKDKDFVQIFDIASSCKYSKKHLAQRVKYYKEKEYPYEIDKINWRQR